MSEDPLVTRGRYQPFGNHHAAVLNHFVDKHDAQELNVITEGISGERTVTSPFHGYESADMIRRSLEDDYEVGYNVKVVSQSEFFDSEVFGILEDNPVYFTREKSHAQVYTAMKSAYGLAFWNDLGITDVDYEPRDDKTPFDEFDRPVETSSTSIREMIGQENQEWRKYVSDSVEDMIDDNDEARSLMGEEPEHGKYVSILKHSLI